MKKVILLFLLTLANIAGAYSVTYKYSGATGASCEPASASGGTEIRCSAPDGFVWSAVSLDGGNSSIKYCISGACLAEINDNVVVDVKFSQETAVHKIDWVAVWSQVYTLSNGYIKVTDLDGKYFLFAASEGDSVKVTPVPSLSYHFQALREKNRVGVKIDTDYFGKDNLSFFAMPDADIRLEAEFAHNLYRILYDMNGLDTLELWGTDCSTLLSCTISKAIYEREGYIFRGWTYEKDQQDTFLLPGTKLPPAPYENDARVQLYAKWFEVKKPQKVNGCYQINDEHELFGYAYIVNGKDHFEQETDACGELVADIVVNESVLDSIAMLRKDPERLLTWTPMGSAEKPFVGRFNGKGHSIKGLYVPGSGSSVGFFAVAQGDVSIDSLGIIDSYFEGYERIGGIVGSLAKKSKLSVTYSYVDLTLSGRNMGGLVGYVFDSSSVYIKGVHRSGKNISESVVGGLVGRGRPASVFTILNSYNESSFECGIHNCTIGGLLGYIGTDYEDHIYENMGDSLIIDSCYNTGAMDGKGNDSYYGIGRSMGGLVGSFTAHYASISNSYNKGSMTTEDGGRDTDYMGGLVASFSGILEITRCHNSGTLKGDGVAGFVAGVGEGSHINISTSYNEGYLWGRGIASGMVISEVGFYGVNPEGTIVNSYNVGEVEVYESYRKVTLFGSGLFDGNINLKIINSYNVTPFNYRKCQISYDTLVNVFYYRSLACEGFEDQSSPDDFIDGSIAWKLYNYNENGVDGHVWGQKVGVDLYPVLNGAGVEGYNPDAPRSSSSSGRVSLTAEVVDLNVSVNVADRKIQIEGARAGSMFALFDMQGRMLLAGSIEKGSRTIGVPMAGSYLLRVGSKMQKVHVK